MRGTPLPMGIYLGSWVDRRRGDRHRRGRCCCSRSRSRRSASRSTPRTLPAAIVTLLLGAACLASLGVAVASVVKSADQAMPVAQLTFLPISFISGIWFPLDGAPDWLVKVSHFFPLSHIVNAFGSCFVPGATGSRFHGGDLAAIAIWTAVGLFVAVRRFRWEP